MSDVRARLGSAGLQAYRGWKLYIEPERLRMRKVVRTWLSRCAPASVVLEVGAGTGFMEPVVKDAIRDAVYIGGDIAPTERSGLVFDATAMPFGSSTVDIVLAVEVLEHMASPESMLAEAARVLRPGGHLIVTVPFMFGVHDFHDYYRYTPLGLEELLGRHDLELTETKVRGGTFVASTGLLRNLILNSIVGKPRDWRAQGRDKKIRWLVSTVVLTPWTLVTWVALGLDSVLDRHTVSPPGYFFWCTRTDRLIDDAA
ncbi:MAG: methyltransferase domain-containing protein [Nocardioidaceae bacterium]|nr:methyltransferase domain-containing protein [Nocardioidaceae bacterium]